MVRGRRSGKRGARDERRQVEGASADRAIESKCLLGRTLASVCADERTPADQRLITT